MRAWRPINDYIHPLTSLLAAPTDIATRIFYLAWFAMFMFFAYKIIKSCASVDRANTAARAAGGHGGRPGGGGGGSNWFGGGYGANPGVNTPPPPYTPKGDTSQPSSASQAEGWRPGFWTGLGMGGLAASLWNAQTQGNDARRAAAAGGLREQEYDWERARGAREASGSLFGGSGASTSRRRFEGMDSDGAGPSNLGEMRSSTAIGSSRVR